MAYIVNRYNGTQLVAVEDGTVDTTTDIRFIGKNYNGFGEAQNENFLHLLEHFAGTTPPTRALSGQVWFDAGTDKLKFYTGNAWKNAGGAEVSSVAPAGLNEGDLWWNTTNNQLYGKTSDDEFLLIGPQAAGDGTTQMLSINVDDTTDVSRTVIIALINDNPLYIISNVEFTLNSTQPSTVPDLTGFTLIKKGITLVNTNSSTGVTANAGTTGEPVIWGTASDALKLNGASADSFLKIDDNREIILNENADGGATVVAARFNDNGFTLGNSNDLAVKITSGTVANILNNIGNEIIFGAARSSGAATSICSVKNVDATNSGIIPSSNSLYNLGTSSLKWSQVHADSFKGNADSATQLIADGSARSAVSSSGSASGYNNTIAARTSSGNLKANLFEGTATSARYADLAEKYSTAEELPAGTAVAVSTAEGHEVEPANASQLCIGVVSTDPAYMMNSEAEGQYIGLKGRLPVRVSGPIKKGQPVYAMSDGVCTSIATTSLVGIALESNSNEEEKLVECVLKV